MSKVIHCGWGMSNGRPICCSTREPETTLAPEHITCLRCLAQLARGAEREAERLFARANNELSEANDWRRRMRRVTAARAVVERHK